jgi:hypothetical protein
MSRPEGRSMLALFDPCVSILPAAQVEIWSDLKPASEFAFVLYGGTAIALQLGHRTSVDFDFFCAEPLDKDRIRSAFGFLGCATILQDDPDTLVAVVTMPSGLVKISFFGGIGFGRINNPRRTRDGVLAVASLEDLLATKLKAILDRAEAKDYIDIAALISAGVSLERGLGAFKRMFRGEPSQVLRAIGFFKDGDLETLAERDRRILRLARDRIGHLPDVAIIPGLLPGSAD